MTDIKSPLILRILLLIFGLAAGLLLLFFLKFLIDLLILLWPLFYGALDNFLTWQAGWAEAGVWPLLFKILFFLFDLLLIPLLFLWLASFIYAILPAFIFLASGIEWFFPRILSRGSTLWGATLLSSVMRAGTGMGPLPTEEYENIAAGVDDKKPLSSSLQKSAWLWLGAMLAIFSLWLFPGAVLADVLTAAGVIAVGGIAILLARELWQNFKRRNKKGRWWQVLILVLSLLFLACLISAVALFSALPLWAPALVWLIGGGLYVGSWQGPKH